MAESFLPPDPHAPAPPAPRPPATGPAFAPPSARLQTHSRRRDNRATGLLAFGVAALAILVASFGGLFFITLPCSVAVWILAAQAKRRASDQALANVAVLLGIVGTVAGAASAIAWVVVAAVD